MENFLILKLKKQIKQLKVNTRKDKNEIKKLKKNIKYTMRQELEMQVQAYQNETIRLRHMLE